MEVSGIEPEASRMRSERSTPELHPQNTFKPASLCDFDKDYSQTFIKAFTVELG